MRDPEQRRLYDVAARAHQQVAGQRRRPSRWTAYRRVLREQRENAKRAGLAWNAAAAREGVRQHLRSSWHSKWQKIREGLRKAHADRRAAQVAADEAVMQEADAVMAGGGLPHALESTAPELIAEHGGVWRWYPAVRRDVEQRAANRKGIQDQLFEWHQAHATLTAGPCKVLPETKAARRYRMCCAEGRCVSHSPGRCLGMLAKKCRDFVVAAAGRETKPKSGVRLILESAHAVLRLSLNGIAHCLPAARTRAKPEGTAGGSRQRSPQLRSPPPRRHSCSDCGGDGVLVLARPTLPTARCWV